MSALRSHYLTTLGIDKYLHHCINTEDLASHLIKVRCLVVETDHAESIFHSTVAQEFLYTMLLAIGLDKQEVVCIQSGLNQIPQEICKYDAEVILIMDEHISPINNKMFVMPHPSDILKNETLKRTAWEVLKQMKVCLQ
ncbi:MAG: hypothetical protein K0U20_03005 [Proteobacteria bacterium]|mgnify:CR=1 FL=1|nr:hypothetical protein [Pseudomonadota bacterium]